MNVLGLGEKQAISNVLTSDACSSTRQILQRALPARGRPSFGYGFGYSAETVSKMTFDPLSVSTNVYTKESREANVLY